MLKYKIALITMIINMLLFNSSCSFKSDSNAQSVRKEHYQILKSAMCDRNISDISELYCKTVQSQIDLSTELNKMFEYINGDIIEVGDMNIATDGEQWDNGECTRLDCSYNVDFSTATDNYRMEVSENYIIANNHDHEGITFISIHHMDNNFNYISNDKFIVGDTGL